MRKFHLLRLIASFVAPLLTCWAAQASQPVTPTPSQFAWSAPGIPGSIVVELPEMLAAAAITGVAPPAGFTLAGFASDDRAGTLTLRLLPTGDRGSLSGVDLELGNGGQQRLEIGKATVVATHGSRGPLRFERSLAAPAGGLYLAVVLRNDGDHSLRVSAIESFDPAPEGAALLYASGGEAAGLLATLEGQMTPAAVREANGSREVDAPSGFEWIDPAAPDLTIPPATVLVLAWTGRALPAIPGAWISRPVVEYRLDDGTVRRLLGVPVAIRSEP